MLWSAAVRRAPSQSLLGPALLLYLVADAAAAQGQLDWVGALCVVLAGALALAPAAMARKAELPGSQRAGALGARAGYALVRSIAPDGCRSSVDSPRRSVPRAPARSCSTWR